MYCENVMINKSCLYFSRFYGFSLRISELCYTKVNTYSNLRIFLLKLNKRHINSMSTLTPGLSLFSFSIETELLPL